MANDFSSNFTRKLAPIVLKSFETRRGLSKNVNTQLLDGAFEGKDTGEDVDFKRATDYLSKRTADGDVSAAGNKSDIITGKATGTVQPYFTVLVDYKEAEEAIKMAQKNELVDIPMMDRIVTDLEVDYAKFMMRNCGLLVGTPGTAITTWKQVARAGAMLGSSGVPRDSDWCFGMNDFTQVELAGEQRSLGVNPEAGSANDRAVVKEKFAGMRVMACDALASFTTHSAADRAGTLSSAPDATYSTARNTMQQTIAVTGLGANLEVKAGETVTIAGRNRLNLSTRQPVIDQSGGQVVFSGVVQSDVTLNGAGAGTLVISGPAINEANGQYNTVDSAPQSGDVVTLGGSNNAIIQPNLFWHKQAFGIGSVPMEKLHSTDTLAKTHDGLQLRISRGVGFLENVNKVRIDLRVAYAALNPFFAGHAFG